MCKIIKIILFLVFSLTSAMSYSQDFYSLAQKEFKSSADFKYAEPDVLKCSKYLLNNPVDLAQLNRLYAVEYISKWMTGTPDHRFILNKKIMNLGEEYVDLKSIHMASLANCALDIEHVDLTANQCSEAASKQLITYCFNPKNKISLPPKLKPDPK